MICLPRNSVGLHNDLLPYIGLHNYSTAKNQYPETELRGHSPNCHIHVSVSDLYIPTRIDLPILLQEICGPILGIYK